jgi:hypothetical protein
LFNLIAYIPKSWECNPTNTPISPEMWGLDWPLDWWIKSVELAQNGANAIRTLTIKEIVAMIEHLYLDEDDGH